MGAFGSVTLTVLSGTVVAAFSYLASQFISHYIFKRLDEYHHLRGRISEALIYYANVYCSPSSYPHPYASEKPRSPSVETMCDEFRKYAAAIMTFSYKTHFLLLGLPSREDLQKVGGELIGISNMSAGDATTNSERAEAIRLILKTNSVEQ